MVLRNNNEILHTDRGDGILLCSRWWWSWWSWRGCGYFKKMMLGVEEMTIIHTDRGDDGGGQLKNMMIVCYVLGRVVVVKVLRKWRYPIRIVVRQVF